MAERRPWSRDELLVAFALYLKLPLRMHHERHPEVIGQAMRLERAPAAVAMKLGNIRSLDDSITSTGRSGLRNASKADREMWAEMQSDWTTFIAVAETALNSDAAKQSENGAVADYAPEGVANDGNLADDPPVAVSADSLPSLDDHSVHGTDIAVTATRRSGQTLFRQIVLSAYRNQCALTGLSDPRLLVASHIIPWSQAPGMRLNPRNGIALNALYDKAFDRGLITFDDDLRLQISPALEADHSEFADLAFRTRAGTRLAVPDKFAPDPDALTYHRATIYLH